MDHPTRLASNSSGTLTPQTLYLLERFNYCARHQAQSEENLLHYLQLANQDLPQHSAETVNGLLAHLLGWSTEQVSCLTALLTPKRATTMQAVGLGHALPGVLLEHRPVGKPAAQGRRTQ